MYIKERGYGLFKSYGHGHASHTYDHYDLNYNITHCMKIRSQANLSTQVRLLKEDRRRSRLMSCNVIKLFDTPWKAQAVC